mmetsp:Transcript_43973/g.83993  ORF Transcript_43973/g.83993 Transcript_43973/m.83993 type:complete len:426 (+) Transcript_43973:1-1278(+)
MEHVESALQTIHASRNLADAVPGLPDLSTSTLAVARSHLLRAWLHSIGLPSSRVASIRRVVAEEERATQTGVRGNDADGAGDTSGCSPTEGGREVETVLGERRDAHALMRRAAAALEAGEGAFLARVKRRRLHHTAPWSGTSTSSPTAQPQGGGCAPRCGEQARAYFASPSTAHKLASIALIATSSADPKRYALKALEDASRDGSGREASGEVVELCCLWLVAALGAPADACGGVKCTTAPMQESVGPSVEQFLLYRYLPCHGTAVLLEAPVPAVAAAATVSFGVCRELVGLLVSAILELKKTNSSTIAATSFFTKQAMWKPPLVSSMVAGGDAGQHVAPLPGVRLPEDPWRDAGAATCCSGKVACQHNLIHNERQIIGPNPNHTERSESTETVVSQFIQHIGWLGGDVEGYATTAFARAGIDWV